MWMRTMASIAGLCLLGVGAATWAQAPEILSHQGHLWLPDGASAPNGTYRIRFGIFPAETGGPPLFERDLDVRVEQGLYHVLLSGAPGALEDALSGMPRYLGLTVLEGPGVILPTTLTPRQEVGGVPFARRARHAGRADIVSGSPASGMALPTGAILLSAEATCPPGFEALDGSSQQGGAPHDLRGRLVVGADLGGAEPAVPDSAGVPGGVSSHRHARVAAVSHTPFAFVAADLTPSVPPPEHHHNSSSDCQPNGCWSNYTAARPPFATVTFCRKI